MKDYDLWEQILKELKMSRQNIAIIFGGRSLEHEVSIVTTLQAYYWFDKGKYNIYLIYIDPQNNAYLCNTPSKENMRKFIEGTIKNNKKVDFIKKGILVNRGIFQKRINIDVAFLSMHGAYGEDGKFQGMMEFLDIPYTYSGVLGCALGMDKVLMKNLFSQMGLLTTPFIWFFVKEYKEHRNECLEKIKGNLKYPLFVKPVNGGSSIGVSKVKSEKELEEAIDKVLMMDNKILIEQGVEGSIDINCSVIGGYSPVASVCEQPISEDELLSFKEKYLKGGKMKGMVGLSRIIPAPIPDKIAKDIQEKAKTIFKEFNCWGLIRVDFLYQKRTGKVFANEFNVIPGSHAYYFWQQSGITSTQLMDKLINLALDRKKEVDSLNLVYKSEIIDQK